MRKQIGPTWRAMMFQGDRGPVLILVLAVIAISLVLAVMVIAFKITRDRRERRSRRFREEFLAALAAMDQGRLTKVCRRVSRGGEQLQTDFIQTMDRAENADWWSPEHQALVDRAAQVAQLGTALRRQLSARSDSRRGLSVAIAGFADTGILADELLPFLVDPEPTVRLAAAGSLERMATPDAARVLVSALVRELLTDERVIERLGHPWAVPSILEVLEDRSSTLDTRTRAGLARALTLAADPRAVSAMEVMAADGPIEERLQALKALAACSAGATDQQRVELEFFARYLVDDVHPVVRTQAVSILGTAGNQSDIPILTQMVGDSDWFVRRAAARSLVQLGPQGMAALRRVARSDDEFAAQRAREEIVFATIMAARRSAETGEDLQDILGEDIEPWSTGSDSAAVASTGPGPAAAGAGSPARDVGTPGADPQPRPSMTLLATPDAPSGPWRLAPPTSVQSYVPAIVMLGGPSAGAVEVAADPLDDQPAPAITVTTEVYPSSAVSEGQPLALVGRVRPRGKSRRARLQVRLGGSWRTVDTTRLTGKGKFAFAVTDLGSLGATYVYRIVILGKKKERRIAAGEPITVLVDR